MRPVVHYMMGGVHTDINGATPLAGLYAAGEVACVSINGANRLGSNSLPELLVFGARAGRAAAEYASRRQELSPARRSPRPRTSGGGWSSEFLRKTGGRERLASLRDEMQQTMEQSAGIYRTGDVAGPGGRQAARAAGALPRRRPRGPQPDVQHRADRRRWSWVHARRGRDDRPLRPAPRGVARRHQRTDFPARDDQRFLAHSLAYRNADGSCRVEYLPVTITRWPPGERVYGK